jgi:lipopolysaccharide transport system ATP-binding protein
MKSDLAIVAEGIGKEYVIGAKQRNNSNLRESLADMSKSAIRTIRGGLQGLREQRKLNSFWALRDVGFEIKQGEVVGVIGCNGAGKSTLLKVLSRITDPTTGSVLMRGRVGSLLEVGTGFHPELSGRENTFLNGAILGMSRTQVKRQFDEIVAFSGVDKFIDTPVKRYSSGMYLRLAFAVAAHLDPEILLVDEVLAVGDAQFQAKCIGKMESVAQEGRTVLFVSHNMSAVRSLCSRGLVLRGGQIAYQGSVQTAIQEYFSDLGILGGETSEEVHDGRSVFGRVTLNQGTTNTVGQSEPFELSTWFSLPKAASGFRLWCLFTDMRSQQLIAICRTSEELGFGSEVPPGRHELTLQFPALWLNPGMYSVHFKMLMSGDANSQKHVSNTFPLDVSGHSSPVEAILNPQTQWHVEAKDSSVITGAMHGN